MPSFGQPASTISCPSFSADTGVRGPGRTTMGLPAAIAGAALCATSSRGKLNGVIPAIGPSGIRRIWASRFSVPGSQSSERISPWILRASSAPTLNVNAARSTSRRAVRIGLPASSATVRANSSRRSANARGHGLEDRRALPRGQGAGQVERRGGSRDRPLDVRRPRVVDDGKQRPIVGTADLERCACAQRVAADQDAELSQGRRELCFSHEAILLPVASGPVVAKRFPPEVDDRCRRRHGNPHRANRIPRLGRPTGRIDEPRNIETPPGGRGRNPDAALEPERRRLEDEDINTHGSER